MTNDCVRTSLLSLASKNRRAYSQLPRLPDVGAEIREQSLHENEERTVLYLAYGSNLCNETFRGRRNIKPISQTNVQVPELRLTFDLPGIAYSEPCFANTARRDAKEDVPQQMSEKSNGTEKPDDYHKERWHKGLVGVVYEVTHADYVQIIATEGGGSAYHDILVDCYPFACSDPAQPVPKFPVTKPFKAHTLFAPATPPGKHPRGGGRLQRPNTAYAQASPRYLKLITDGAAECRLPYEYQDYLNSLQPYTITTNQQRLGQFVFLSIWMPFIVFIFAMQRAFSDNEGVAPEWLRTLAAALFQACWASYDGYFKDTFGDGERTTSRGDVDDENGLGSSTRNKWIEWRRVAQSGTGLLEV